ncbi:hypothetical protein L915_13187 [Phytophthora nicotianae]|uniref:DDE Tnp4 domain-containing protein n=2 Tax=Phytophthora nicotianae TaxID=4792 RepID=W2GE82_PHYNI|nr:hypothetical protein L915_13187 [Phytophthora nicotianae]
MIAQDVISVARRLRQQKNTRLALLLFALTCRRPRKPRVSRQRVDVDYEVEMLLNENMFERTFRMPAENFSHLLRKVTPAFTISERRSTNSSGEAPISPSIMLMATSRYLAGGSYLDIRPMVGISEPSYYRVIDLTMDAILALEELQITFPNSDSEKEVVMEAFKNISSGGIMSGCIGCVDGWLCCIKTPTLADAGEVGVGRY